MILGPTQVGKTTSIRQVLEAIGFPSHYVTADTATLQSSAWLDEQWTRARQMLSDSLRPVVLAVDEVQKVASWPSWVKRLRDEDSFAGRDVRVLLSGSSPLLMQQGLAESLAGRFETLPMTHWAWPECRDAFGWDLDRFVFFGGYPGSAPFIDDIERWRAYILDSVIESTVSRDILLMTRIDKPALLRRLFHLACEYAGRELTFEKMVRGLDVEVDYVTVRGAQVTAIEVKSGATIGSLEGLGAFRSAFGSSVATQLVGTGGVPIDEFLSQE